MLKAEEEMEQAETKMEKAEAELEKAETDYLSAEAKAEKAEAQIIHQNGTKWQKKNVLMIMSNHCFIS